MPHDGQDIAMTKAVLLPDLIATTRAALPAGERHRPRPHRSAAASRAAVSTSETVRIRP